MSQESKRICPVCGSVASGEVAASPYRCGSCGFGNAYIAGFAGKRSYELWQRQIKEAGSKRFQMMQKKCVERNAFYLCENGVAYISPEEGKCELITSEYGVTTYDDKVMQYSVSENHSVRLLRDGTVKAVGENDYHQCDVKQLENITFVLAAPRCTYAVNKGGQVLVCGSPVSSGVKNWNGIRTLACGAYHVAGLTQRGTVISEGLAEPVAKQISQWKDVADIKASGDCTLALHSDGRVSFAGRADDPRAQAASWKDITAIAVDSIYAVGLTKDGQVVLAGKCQKEFLDMGRKKAAEWSNVVAISCSRSGIGALCQDGTVKLAGNILEIGEVQQLWQKKAFDVKQQLQKIAVL